MNAENNLTSMKLLFFCSNSFSFQTFQQLLTWAKHLTELEKPWQTGILHTEKKPLMNVPISLHLIINEISNKSAK